MPIPQDTNLDSTLRNKIKHKGSERDCALKDSLQQKFYFSSLPRIPLCQIIKNYQEIVCTSPYFCSRKKRREEKPTLLERNQTSFNKILQNMLKVKSTRDSPLLLTQELLDKTLICYTIFPCTLVSVKLSLDPCQHQP